MAINLSKVRVNMMKKESVRTKNKTPEDHACRGFLYRKDTAFRLPSKGRSYAAIKIWMALNLNIRVLSSNCRNSAIDGVFLWRVSVACLPQFLHRCLNTQTPREAL